MKRLLLALVLLASPAISEEGEFFEEGIFEHAAELDRCMTEASPDACERQVEIAVALAQAGYCYINREWKPCE